MFNCRAYVHIPKDKRSKLNNKVNKYISLGYEHEEFGYKLWDAVAEKVIRSIYIVFLDD